MEEKKKCKRREPKVTVRINGELNFERYYKILMKVYDEHLREHQEEKGSS